MSEKGDNREYQVDNLSNSDIEQHSEKETQTARAAPPTAPPDGGLKAWLCVLGGFCVRILSYSLFLRASTDLCSALSLSSLVLVSSQRKSSSTYIKRK